MRTARMLAVAALLSLLTGSTAQSDLLYVTDQWYTDSTFTDVCAYREKDCDGNITQWGNASNWRSQTMAGCNSGSERVRCYHWNGSSWEDVPCYMENGRLRVPVG